VKFFIMMEKQDKKTFIPIVGVQRNATICFTFIPTNGQHLIHQLQLWLINKMVNDIYHLNLYKKYI